MTLYVRMETYLMAMYDKMKIIRDIRDSTTPMYVIAANTMPMTSGSGLGLRS